MYKYIYLYIYLFIHLFLILAGLVLHKGCHGFPAHMAVWGKKITRLFQSVWFIRIIANLG